MSSQDDQGIMWYGVSGVPFNPTDPSEVMLNTGITAPLLSDHPRSLINQQTAQFNFSAHLGSINFNNVAEAQQRQLQCEQQSDFMPNDFTYDTYDNYEDDSVDVHGLNSNNQLMLCLNDEDNSSLSKTKKPKVHQNPALKLKTPIAYQKDTDISAIPIMRDGMAVCKKCGAIGVRHAFYGKERQFCSLSCARPPNLLQRDAIDIAKIINRISSNEAAETQSKKNSDQELENKHPGPFATPCYSSSPLEDPSFVDIQKLSSPNVSSTVDSDSCSKDSSDIFANISNSNSEKIDFEKLEYDFGLKKNPIEDSFNWEVYLQSENFLVAPVNEFKHSPMSECWNQISVGMKVEVSCGAESLMEDSFWVASVILICGYKAKLRFEGFIDEKSKDFWVDLCSEEVHPVGWCATQGKPLIPPKTIQHKYKDWKEFLMRRLTGARTLPTNFFTKVTESLKSRFRVGMNLEVVDKNRVAQMRVATVTEIIGGRMHLKYHGAPQDDDGFWCHEDSSIIHPVGWSLDVGHEIVASQSYHERCTNITFEPLDAAPSLFVQPPVYSEAETFLPGMKLEAIDPLNISTICVATIMKVLENNYLMIRIDSYDTDITSSDWFCYHAYSGNVFPAGFCNDFKIPLTPPKGHAGNFSWERYLADSNSVAAPSSYFHMISVNHGFTTGMCLEAADLMDPHLICAATIKEVKGRLLRIHFIGWEETFDQWVDCRSPDIYPVGWCSLIGYKLERPHTTVVSHPVASKAKKHNRGRPFGMKRAPSTHSATGDDFSSVSSAPSMTSTGTRRGRKPRWRGQNNVTKPRSTQNQNLGDTDMGISDGSVMGCNFRGRRGRPRGGHSRVSIANRARPRTQSIGKTVSSSMSEGDSSDETSGVASMAGSETSFDDWDTDTNGLNSLSDHIARSKIEQAKEIVNPNSSTSNSVTSDPNLGYFGSGQSLCSSSVMTSSNTFPSSEIPKSLPSGPVDSPSDYVVTSTLDVSFMKTQENTMLENIAFDPSLSLMNSAQQDKNNFNQYAMPPLSIPNKASPQNSLPMCPISGIPETTSINLPSVNAFTGHPNSGNAFTGHQNGAGVFMGSSQNGMEFDMGQMTSNSTVTNQNYHSPLANTVNSHFNSNCNINTVENVVEPVDLYIPRIIDNLGSVKGSEIKPKSWSCEDVSKFLIENDCSTYCQTFVENNVDGAKFLRLNQNDILGLTGMKVGPSLKIHSLIQQLLAIVNPAQARYQATLLKRSLAFGKP